VNRERSHPPALATWLLRRLCPKQNRDTITGDLFERFGEGRSDAWFWRQVLVAILVGFSRQLRVHWSQICFAAAGTGVLWWSLIRRGPTLGHLWVWNVGLPFFRPAIFDVSLVRALVVIPLLYMYLLLSDALGRGSMLRAFLTGLSLFAVGDMISGWLFKNYSGAAVSHALVVVAFRESWTFFTLLISARVSCPLPSRSQRIAP
jgi:hypothetical protein